MFGLSSYIIKVGINTEIYLVVLAASAKKRTSQQPLWFKTSNNEVC